jgi:predicted nicotinamide N-methyase
MQNTELDHLIEKINSKYVVEAVPLKIGDKTLRILQLKDFEGHIEELIESKGAGIKDLPYWAKIWDASFLLALYLGKRPVALGQQILEIGAGMGIAGIYAALCGHRVTITDIHEDALLFARANTLLNGIPHTPVMKLDWANAVVDSPYDVIIGSEVVYERENYPVLVRFLLKALAPDGIIFLAKNARLNTPAFFAELTRHFEYKETVQTIRSGDEAQRIGLFAIRRKTWARTSAIRSSMP